MKKVKRIFMAIISAALCAAMLSGISVSAAGKSVWSESKAMTNAKYYSKYIKLTEKYSKKETKNTVTYEKSRTKKYVDKVFAVVEDENANLDYSIINKDEILSLVRNGDNVKRVIYSNGIGEITYGSSEKVTVLNVADKTKYVYDVPEEYSPEYSTEVVRFGLDFGIDNDEKGKIFKFKFEEKIYYYEEFEGENFGTTGFLFSEKGTPLTINVNGDIYCYKLSFTVDDSAFKIPKGYKAVDFYDFYFD